MGQYLASELAHGSTAETGRQIRLRDKRLRRSTLGIVIRKEEHWEPFPFAFLAEGGIQCGLTNRRKYCSP